MWVCICVPHALSGTHRDRNRACDPLKPELQSIVSLYVDTDYQTDVLYQGSIVTEPCLQPRFKFFLIYLIRFYIHNSMYFSIW